MEQQQQQPPQRQTTQEEELLKTLRESNSKEDWDQFFAIRGSDDSYEFYAEWTQLESLLATQLSFQSNEQRDSAGAQPPVERAQLESILSSLLSIQPELPLASAGKKPRAEWTQLESSLSTQLSSLSKEPQESTGPQPPEKLAQLENLLATQPSSQSKEQLYSVGVPLPAKQPSQVRILVPGCGNSKLSEHLYDAGFTNIINVDFSKVVITHMLRRNVRDRPLMKWRVMDMTSMQFENETFDAVVDKGGLDSLMGSMLGTRLGYLYLSEVKRILKAGGKYVCLTLAEARVLDLLFPIFRFGWKMSLYIITQEASSRDSKLHTLMVVAEKDGSTAVFDISMDKFSVESHGNQALDLNEALGREKNIRFKYSHGSDIVYSLEDLHLGAKGNISELEPGRRVKLILGGPDVSCLVYNGILLDAKQHPEPFVHDYTVYLVPHNRVHDFVFSSEDGQWQVAVGSKAARLLVIFLDSSNSGFGMEFIQGDLYSLAKELAPGFYDHRVEIPFMSASDGIEQREFVHKAKSALTGPIVVEDVIYQGIPDDEDVHKGRKFRRLTFQRTADFVQSEGLLSKKRSHGISSEVEKGREQKSPKLKKKAKQRYDDHSSASQASSHEAKVLHNSLNCAYHLAIISGIMLISSHFKASTTDGGLVETVVVGLGAGLLPMFMKNYLPSLNITVLELDPVVPSVAREYFGFREDERLKVHIADGVEYIKAIACSEADEKNKVHILVVDVYSTDPSSGLACPKSKFVDELFLMNVKKVLSKEGLFIINLVSRSSAVKESVYARLQKEFENVFSLQLEDEINQVLFAVNECSPMNEDQLSEACAEIETSLDWCLKVVGLSKWIKPLVKTLDN